MWNSGENLSLLSSNTYLAIEKRNIPGNLDFNTLYMNNLNLSNYTFELFLEQPSVTNFDVFIHDKPTPNKNGYVFGTDAILPKRDLDVGDSDAMLAVDDVVDAFRMIFDFTSFNILLTALADDDSVIFSLLL